MTAPLEAATIVGLLADADRRRAFAAVQLGATRLDLVVERASLTTARAATALGRLAAAGLVVDDNGSLQVPDEVFQVAARAALSRPASTEHADLAPDVRRVMAAFVEDGRLLQIPTSRAKRLVVLDWLAQDFELGTRYTESMVNLVLGRRHPDTAALRRYLVDEEILGRASGNYWRIGGTTPV